MAAGRALRYPQTPLLLGMDVARGSAILLSVCSGSVLVAVPWVQSGAQELLSLFSIAVVDAAPRSEGRRGQRWVPPSPGALHPPGHGGKGWAWIRNWQLRSGGGQQVEGDPGTPLGIIPMARGGSWQDQPSSGRCRRRGRGRQLPAAGPGGSAAAPPAQFPSLLPAASAGGEKREHCETPAPNPLGTRGPQQCPEQPHHSRWV